MQLLFGDSLAPITSTVGFLEVPSDTAVEAFLFWQSRIYQRLGISLAVKNIEGDLKSVLLQLLPLTSVQRRRLLFIPTASGWTAFFDNGWRGTDAAAPMSYLAGQLKCRGIRVVAVPHTMREASRTAKGRYGATILEVYGTDGKTVRSICAANDGGKWVFYQSGQPFLFERTERYKERRVKDRFTFELLDEYLRGIGVCAFDPEFYLAESSDPAQLISKIGPLAPSVKEYTLAEARKGSRLDT
jgi:hypothetical protein